MRGQRKDVYQIVRGPMDGSNVDNVPYNFDSSTRDAVDFIRMLLNQIADLLLIPGHVIIDCLRVGEYRIKLLSPIGLMSFETELKHDHYVYGMGATNIRFLIVKS